MSTLQLTVHEAELAGGAHGEAAQLAMRIVARFGEVTGASRLVEISGAHIDACMFHGQVSLDFVDRLLELGAKVAVPTTLNVGTIDLLHPELSRADEQQREWGRRVMHGYAALGARRTWTCAPYQEAQRPGLGKHVAWAESNAIVFANSALGARTDRYGDFFDVCAAITGRVPYAGLHIEENRRATVCFDASGLPEALLASELSPARIRDRPPRWQRDPCARPGSPPDSPRIGSRRPAPRRQRPRTQAWRLAARGPRSPTPDPAVRVAGPSRGARDQMMNCSACSSPAPKRVSDSG